MSQVGPPNGVSPAPVSVADLMESVAPILIRILVVFPIGLALVVSALNPDSLRKIASTPGGLATLTVALVFVACDYFLAELGIWCIRRKRMRVGLGLGALAILFAFVIGFLALLVPALAILVGTSS